MSASVLLAKTKNNSASSPFVRIQRMIEIIGVMPVPPATNPTFFAMPSIQ